MVVWIGIVVVIVLLAGIASWRRRGRSSGDQLADQRPDLTENVLRTRSRGPFER
jgi:hypothetical protein